MNQHNDIEKGHTNVGLIRKQIIDKNGHSKTVYVRVHEDGSEHHFAVGHKVIFEHNGKNIEGNIAGMKYHEKYDKYGTASIEDKDGSKYSKTLRQIENHKDNQTPYSDKPEIKAENSDKPIVKMYDRPDMEYPVYSVDFNGQRKFIQRQDGMNPGDTAWFEVSESEHPKKEGVKQWSTVKKKDSTLSQYFHNIGYNKQEAIDKLAEKYPKDVEFDDVPVDSLADNKITEKNLTKYLDNIGKDQIFRKWADLRFGGYGDDDFDLKPEDLINGWCDSVASYIKIHHPDDEDLKVFDSANYGNGHTFLEYKGKYYDGFNINGVKNPLDLKFHQPYVKKDGSSKSHNKAALDEINSGIKESTKSWLAQEDLHHNTYSLDKEPRENFEASRIKELQAMKKKGVKSYLGVNIDKYIDIVSKKNDIKKADIEDISQNANYKFYDQKSLGIERHNMPQIDEDSIDEFLIHFAGKVKVSKLKMALDKIKPTQCHINEDKVIDMIANEHDWKSRKYIISADNYLLDGHHSYAMGLEFDPSHEVTVYRVNLKMKALISRAKKLKIANKVDINDTVVKAEEIQYYIETGHRVITEIALEEQLQNVYENFGFEKAVPNTFKPIVFFEKGERYNLLAELASSLMSEHKTLPDIRKRIMFENSIEFKTEVKDTVKKFLLTKGEDDDFSKADWYKTKKFEDTGVIGIKYGGKIFERKIQSFEKELTFQKAKESFEAKENQRREEIVAKIVSSVTPDENIAKLSDFSVGEVISFTLLDNIMKGELIGFKVIENAEEPEKAFIKFEDRVFQRSISKIKQL